MADLSKPQPGEKAVPALGSSMTRLFYYGVGYDQMWEFSTAYPTHLDKWFELEVSGDDTKLPFLVPPAGKMSSDQCAAWVRSLRDGGYSVATRQKK